MAQMLAMVCNEHQNDWDVHLPHIEYAYNNSVSAATSLAPNEVYMGRLPRLPLTIFDRSYGGMHQNLDRDQLAYCDLARERQQRAYKLVREQHALTSGHPTLEYRSFGLMGETPPSPMPSATAPNMRPADGFEFITPPPLSAKGCGKAPTTKSSKKNYH